MIAMEPVQGKVITAGGKTVLHLGGPDDTLRVYLSYALVTQGPGHHILPSVLLDDWGKEISQMQIYPWVRENGLRFPRAELFGTSPAGHQVQYFLRDIELFGAYPVYAFAAEDAPENAGVLVQAVLIADDTVAEARPISPPEGVSVMLREAHVTWWAVNPHLEGVDFLG